jgi:hypothetical protein
MYRRIAQLLVMSWLCFSMSLSAWGAENQNWKIKIRVDGSTTYGYAVAGVRDTATEGYDLAWDVQAFLDNLNTNETDPYIYVYFPRADLGVNLSEDIKDTLLPKDWLVEIDSNITGLLTITWPDLAAKLPDHLVSITDLDGAGTQTIDMQGNSSFSFDNTAGVLRQFQLSIDTPSVPDPYNLRVKAQRKIMRLSWDMATEPEADQYIVFRKAADGAFEELQRLNIEDNQFSDKLDKTIVRTSGQTELTYKVTTVNAADEEIRSSIEVSVTYISSY